MPDPRMLEFPTLLRPTLDDIRKADPSGGSDRFLPVTKQKGLKPERRGSGVYRDGPPTAFHDYSSPELRTTAKAFFLQPTPDVAGGPPPASHRKNDEPSEDGRGSAEEEEEAVVFSTDDKSWLAEEVALEREFGTEQISCREEGESRSPTVYACAFGGGAAASFGDHSGGAKPRPSLKKRFSLSGKTQKKRVSFSCEEGTTILLHKEEGKVAGDVDGDSTEDVFNSLQEALVKGAGEDFELLLSRERGYAHGSRNSLFLAEGQKEGQADEGGGIDVIPTLSGDEPYAPLEPLEMDAGDRALHAAEHGEDQRDSSLDDAAICAAVSEDLNEKELLQDLAEATEELFSAATTIDLEEEWRIDAALRETAKARLLRTGGQEFVGGKSSEEAGQSVRTSIGEMRFDAEELAELTEFDAMLDALSRRATDRDDAEGGMNINSLELFCSPQLSEVGVANDEEVGMFGPRGDQRATPAYGKKSDASAEVEGTCDYSSGEISGVEISGEQDAGGAGGFSLRGGLVVHARSEHEDHNTAFLMDVESSTESIPQAPGGVRSLEQRHKTFDLEREFGRDEDPELVIGRSSSVVFFPGAEGVGYSDVDTGNETSHCPPPPRNTVVSLTASPECRKSGSQYVQEFCAQNRDFARKLTFEARSPIGKLRGDEDEVMMDFEGSDGDYNTTERALAEINNCPNNMARVSTSSACSIPVHIDTISSNPWVSNFHNNNTSSLNGLPAELWNNTKNGIEQHADFRDGAAMRMNSSSASPKKRTSLAGMRPVSLSRSPDRKGVVMKSPRPEVLNDVEEKIHTLIDPRDNPLVAAGGLTTVVLEDREVELGADGVVKIPSKEVDVDGKEEATATAAETNFLSGMRSVPMGFGRSQNLQPSLLWQRIGGRNKCLQYEPPKLQAPLLGCAVAATAAEEGKPKIAIKPPIALTGSTKSACVDGNAIPLAPPAHPTFRTSLSASLKDDNLLVRTSVVSNKSVSELVYQKQDLLPLPRRAASLLSNATDIGGCQLAPAEAVEGDGVVDLEPGKDVENSNDDEQKMQVTNSQVKQLAKQLWEVEFGGSGGFAAAQKVKKTLASKYEKKKEEAATKVSTKVQNRQESVKTAAGETMKKEAAAGPASATSGRLSRSGSQKRVLRKSPSIPDHLKRPVSNSNSTSSLGGLGKVFQPVARCTDSADVTPTSGAAPVETGDVNCKGDEKSQLLQSPPAALHDLESARRVVPAETECTPQCTPDIEMGQKTLASRELLQRAVGGTAAAIGKPPSLVSLVSPAVGRNSVPRIAAGVLQLPRTFGFDPQQLRGGKINNALNLCSELSRKTKMPEHASHDQFDSRRQEYLRRRTSHKLREWVASPEDFGLDPAIVLNAFDAQQSPQKPLSSHAAAKHDESVNETHEQADVHADIEPGPLQRASPRSFRLELDGDEFTRRGKKSSKLVQPLRYGGGARSTSASSRSASKESGSRSKLLELEVEKDREVPDLEEKENNNKSSTAAPGPGTSGRPVVDEELLGRLLRIALGRELLQGDGDPMEAASALLNKHAGDSLEAAGGWSSKTGASKASSSREDIAQAEQTQENAGEPDLVLVDVGVRLADAPTSPTELRQSKEGEPRITEKTETARPRQKVAETLRKKGSSVVAHPAEWVDVGMEREKPPESGRHGSLRLEVPTASVGSRNSSKSSVATRYDTETLRDRKLLLQELTADVGSGTAATRKSVVPTGTDQEEHDLDVVEKVTWLLEQFTGGTSVTTAAQPNKIESATRRYFEQHDDNFAVRGNKIYTSDGRTVAGGGHVQLKMMPCHQQPRSASSSPEKEDRQTQLPKEAELPSQSKACYASKWDRLSTHKSSKKTVKVEEETFSFKPEIRSKGTKLPSRLKNVKPRYLQAADAYVEKRHEQILVASYLYSSSFEITACPGHPDERSVLRINADTPLLMFLKVLEAGLSRLDQASHNNIGTMMTPRAPGTAPANKSGASTKIAIAIVLVKFFLYHVPFFSFMGYLWLTDTWIPHHYADGLYILPLSMTLVEAIPWNRFLSAKNLRFVLPLRVGLPARLGFVYVVQICHIHLLLTLLAVYKGPDAVHAGTQHRTQGGPWHLFGWGLSSSSAALSDHQTAASTDPGARQKGKAPILLSENRKGLSPQSENAVIPLAGEDPIPAVPLLKSMTVVLPCAGEGEFAKKTAESIFNSWNHKLGDDANDPHPTLHEIIVVDDGTEPKLSESHLPESLQKDLRVKIVRNDNTVGLINAKKIGGDHATGDIITFFDCHVAPQADWYVHFFESINQNYKRIVVPSITALDVGTWTQMGGHGGGVAKCYLTFDADFKWFNSNDNYVPLLSGGLLSMSRRWWEETGGYDASMKGWGGENIDQSLRTWLCGGEMVTLPQVQVAHMWRLGNDKRTQRKYNIPYNSAAINRMRAAKAWFGDYAGKMEHEFDGYGQGANWYGDISNLLAIKSKGNCREFGWYLNRFRNVYIDGGLIPENTFLLQEEVSSTPPGASSQNAANNARCLRYLRGPGTSHDGNGEVAMAKCDASDDRQRWHVANFKLGLRAWNTDQCLVDRGQRGWKTYICDISANDHGEKFRFENNRLVVGGSSGDPEKPPRQITYHLATYHLVSPYLSGSSGSCLDADGVKYDCKAEPGRSRWVQRDFKIPLERELFTKQGFQ
eukprot:g12136.t1